MQHSMSKMEFSIPFMWTKMNVLKETETDLKETEEYVASEAVIANALQVLNKWIEVNISKVKLYI